MLKGQSVLSTITMAGMLIMTMVLLGHRQLYPSRPVQGAISSPTLSSPTLLSQGEIR